MSKMQASFEKVAKLESDVMSECKNENIRVYFSHFLIPFLFIVVPVEEEALTTKFVWGQVLSENLARLSQNHFATRHYLTQQVLPALQKDLDQLTNFAIELQNDQALEAYQYWIEDYRNVCYFSTICVSFLLISLEHLVCNFINKRYCGLCIH